MKDMFERIAEEAGRLARYNKRRTITHEDIEASCRDQEGRRGSEEAVPGPSVIWGLKLCLPFLNFYREKVYYLIDSNIPALCQLYLYYYYYLFAHAVQHVGSYFPNQGSNPYTLHWKCRVFSSGSPSLYQLYLIVINKLSVYHMDKSGMGLASVIPSSEYKCN